MIQKYRKNGTNKPEYVPICDCQIRFIFKSPKEKGCQLVTSCAHEKKNSFLREKSRKKIFTLFTVY